MEQPTIDFAPAGTRNVRVEHVVVREAGLPLACLTPISFSSVEAVARELDAYSARLDQLERSISDGLFLVIGGRIHQQDRQRLLRLRRDIHNRRITDETEAGLEHVIPTLLRTELSEWKFLRDRYSQAWANSDQAIRADELRCDEGLLELWGRREVRTGILFSHPSLYSKLSNEPAHSKRTVRRLRQTLIAYLQRMVTKTSPFSTLTAAGFATTSECSASRSDVFGLGATTVREIIQGLQERLWRQLPLRLNPSLAVDSGELRFIAPNAGGGETVVTLERTPDVDLVWQLILRHEDRITPEQLEQRVRELVPRAELSAPLCRLVEKLHGVKLFTANTGAAECDPSVLGRLAALPPVIENMPAAAAGLSRAQAAVDALANPDPEARFESIRNLDVAIAEVRNGLGLKERPTSVHHECVIVDGGPAPEFSNRFEKSLAKFFRLLPLFAPQQWEQRRLRAAFEDRFGGKACEDVPGFLANYAEATGTTDSLPETDEQEQARHGFIEAVSRELARSGSCVSLSQDLIERWGGIADAFKPKGVRCSAGILGHFLKPSAGSEFVLNRVVPGYSALAARYADGPMLAALRQTIRRIAGEFEPVELLITLGFWGQRHPALTPRYLLYPGETTARALSEGIRWSDLSIVIDRATDSMRLRCMRSGRDLLPLHFGTLSPVFFPPIFRLLTCLGPAFAPDFPLLHFLDERHDQAEREQPRRYPRIVIDNLIIQRETWCSPANELIAGKRGRTEFQAFMDLRSWAYAQGMPRHVFVTPMRVTEYLAGASSTTLPGATPRFNRVRKPFYVDWDQLPSHRLFHRYVDQVNSTVTISEALPAPEGGEGECRREYLLELTEAGE
jgi:Lantibiotic dehydratase, N terminus